MTDAGAGAGVRSMEAKVEAGAGAGAGAGDGAVVSLNDASCISTSGNCVVAEVDEAVVVAVPVTEMPPAEAGRSL
jgi:hypothetical protein